MIAAGEYTVEGTKMYDMHLREELDYHPASEAENAYAWSRMNRKPDDAGKVAEAVAAGKFVVVVEVPDYCPFTDATMGMRMLLDSVHDTRGAAENAIAAQFSDDDYGGDEAVYVLPLRDYNPNPVAVIDSSEIPF
jgi:hypothetical protein